MRRLVTYYCRSNFLMSGMWKSGRTMVDCYVLRLAIVLSLCTGIISCGSKENKEASRNGVPDFPVNETVEWENISGEEIIPGSLKIHVGDSCIYLLGRLDGYLVQQVSRKDGHLLGQMVTQGSGPGEAIDPICLSIWDNEQRMDLYDNNTDRFNSYVIENGEAKFLERNEYEANITPPCLNIYRVDSNRVMISQLDRLMNFKRKLTFVNSAGETVFEYDKLPNDNEDARNAMLKHSHNVSFVFSPDGRHLAYGGEFGGAFELFDVKPDRLESKYVTCMFPLSERLLANNSMAIGNAAYNLKKIEVYGIFDIATTNDYVVAAYSKDIPGKFTQIGIWDWKGNPVKNISTGNSIRRIGISPDGKDLYGICDGDDDELFLGRIPLDLPKK